MKRLCGVVVVATSVLALGCSQPEPEAPATPAYEPTPHANLAQLMRGIPFPASNIIFDTGGNNLKPFLSMADMHRLLEASPEEGEPTVWELLSDGARLAALSPGGAPRAAVRRRSRQRRGVRAAAGERSARAARAPVRLRGRRPTEGRRKPAQASAQRGSKQT